MQGYGFVQFPGSNWQDTVHRFATMGYSALVVRCQFVSRQKHSYQLANAEIVHEACPTDGTVRKCAEFQKFLSCLLCPHYASNQEGTYQSPVLIALPAIQVYKPVPALRNGLFMLSDHWLTYIAKYP